MARGFVAGGLSFGVFSLLGIVATLFVPLWLVSRTELVDKFCWYGEGIWETSVRWGDDVPTAGVACNNEASKSASTTDAYCNDVETLYKASDPNYNTEMCKATNAAKGLNVAALVAAVLSLMAGYAAHRVRRFRIQIYCSALATINMLVSTACLLALIIVMQTSPLFSDAHYKDLSKGWAIPYTGISCLFLTPSVGTLIKHGNLDGPMQCLFPGPAFGFVISALIGTFFSMCMFLLKWRESLLVRRIALAHRVDLGNNITGGDVSAVGPSELQRGDSYSPLFGDNIESPFQSPGGGGSSGGGTGPMPSSPMSSAFSGLSSMMSPGAAIPSNFKFERHYSLYGAFLRYYSHNEVWFKSFRMQLPLLFNTAHAIMLGVWVLQGLAYALHVNIDEVKLPRKRNHWWPGSDDAGQIFSSANNMTFEKIACSENWTDYFDQGELLEDPALGIAADYVNEYFASKAGSEFFLQRNFSMLGQVIEFSPITTLNAFFMSGAWWMGIVQLVACFVWPIVKVLLWAWFWFVPADEVFRGRLYGWIDTLGKVALANLFVNSVLAVINHFEREILIPWYLVPLLVKPFHSLRIRFGLAIKPGFGTYGFVISFVLSMLMGEANLYVHRLAKKWEEERREQEEKSWKRVRFSSSECGLAAGGGANSSASPLGASSSASSASTGASTTGGGAIPPSAAALVDASDSDASALAATGSALGLHSANLLSRSGVDDPYDESDKNYQDMDTPYQMMMSSHDLFDAKQARKSKRGEKKKAATAAAAATATSHTNVASRALREHTQAKNPMSFQLDDDEQGDGVDAKPLENRTPPPAPPTNEGTGVAGNLGSRRTHPGKAKSGSARYRWHPGDHISFADSAMDGQVLFYDQHAAEAPCNHIFSPIPGRYHRCTALGKCVMLTLMVCTFVVLYFGLTLNTFNMHRKGLLGDYIIAPEDRYLYFSVIDFPKAVSEVGLFDSTPYTLTWAIALFVIILPCIHILGLSAIWWIPLKPTLQQHLQYWLENLSSWGALDVFTVTLFATMLDVASFTRQLVDSAGLGDIDKILIKLGIGPFIDMSQSLTANYAVLVLAVLMQKVLEGTVMLQLATLLAEKKGVHDIARKAAEMGVRRSSTQIESLQAIQEGNEFEVQHASDGLSSASLQAAGAQEQEEDEGLIGYGFAEANPQRSGASVPLLTPVSSPSNWTPGDRLHRPRLTTELIRENLDVLPSTQGYWLAGGFHGKFYAGLPRYLWRAFIHMGLLREDHTFTHAAAQAAAAALAEPPTPTQVAGGDVFRLEEY